MNCVMQKVNTCNILLILLITYLKMNSDIQFRPHINLLCKFTKIP